MNLSLRVQLHSVMMCLSVQLSVISCQQYTLSVVHYSLC